MPMVQHCKFSFLKCLNSECHKIGLYLPTLYCSLLLVKYVTDNRFKNNISDGNNDY